MKKYFLSVGDALSQLLNALLFNSGNANESISARCYRQRDCRAWSAAKSVIDTVFRLLGEKDHCRKAWYRDVGRARELLAVHAYLRY